MSRFTPGPWQVTKGLHGNDDGLTIWPVGGHGRTKPLIATVRELTKGATANARLIAAAPDLLKALEMLLDSADCNLDEQADETADAIEVCFAAIAKARGVR